MQAETLHPVNTCLSHPELSLCSPIPRSSGITQGSPISCSFYLAVKSYTQCHTFKRGEHSTVHVGYIFSVHLSTDTAFNKLLFDMHTQKQNSWLYGLLFLISGTAMQLPRGAPVLSHFHQHSTRVPPNRTEAPS